jgi:integrase
MIYKRKKLYHMDVTVHGVRYREALDTTDHREALSLEKKRVGEILAGKGASKSGREFARKPFTEATKLFQEERKPHVAERTTQFENERLKPLEKYFGEKPLIRFKAEDVAAYQRHRLKSVAARTVNMEVSVLRRMLKRAKVWTTLAEDVRMFPERGKSVARVLTVEQKRRLFETAASRPDWLVAYCAAVLAVSTTCRGVELKNLRWRDVDLFSRIMTINRSKTEAGHRTIPLNGDALAALARLRERSQHYQAGEPDHFVFPTCEHERIDATRPQKSWRTAWRALLKETGQRSGRKAAKSAIKAGRGIKGAIAEWRRAAAPFKGFRFHDLRHQAITELAETGASDATMMAVAGHMSRQMLEHYSHVRMATKRASLDKLESGLMAPASAEAEQAEQADSGVVH